MRDALLPAILMLEMSVKMTLDRRFAIDLPAIFDEMWFLTTGPMVVTPVILEGFSE